MTESLIVMYTLAGTFILIGIVGGSGMQLGNFSVPIIPRVARIAALTVGALLFAISFYFMAIATLRNPNFSRSPNSPDKESPAQTATAEPNPHEQPIATPARVTFSTPHNGNLVKRKEKISGTALNIPPGKQLWIVVHSQSRSKYYPQAGPVSVASDGSFETYAFFGSPSDTSRGDTFSIIAAVASKKDGDEFTRYHNDSKTKNTFEGLATIPDSVIRVEELTVIRQ